MDLMEMMDALEEYYEAAGFSGVYEKILKDMSKEEIQELYEDTYNETKEIH